MKKRINILHVIKDDKKFFNSVMSYFDSDCRLNNECVLIVKNKNDAFQSIERTDRVEVLSGKKNVKKKLSNYNYDVIYFHSLPYDLWYIIDFIPDDKIIIWWSWGYELYESIRGMKPMLPVDLYKSETYKIVRQSKGTLSYLKNLIKFFLRPFYINKRNKMLSRIDYFQPVIQSEYIEMQKRYNKYFKAKEFYYKNSFGSVKASAIKIQESEYSILFGNSASHTNNHVDVWNVIASKLSNNQKVIVPLSYGDKEYANIVKDKIRSSNCIFLDSFLDQEEYFSLINDCAYFVSGVLRQQAVGNIMYCIQHGIKIFLYKNSVLYKYLNNIGVSVYSLEECTKESFSSPITKEEFQSNINALNVERTRRQNIYEDFISRNLK